jgi:hypothetical protein
MHRKRSCYKSQLFVAQMKQHDAQQLGGFRMLATIQYTK